jgi:hypothetical protein
MRSRVPERARGPARGRPGRGLARPAPRAAAAPAGDATLDGAIPAADRPTHQRGAQLEEVPPAEAPGTQGRADHERPRRAAGDIVGAPRPRRREEAAARGGYRLRHGGGAGLAGAGLGLRGRGAYMLRARG